MLLTGLTLPLSIYAIIQAALIPFEVIHCLARKSDSSRLRFLYLSTLALGLNITILILPSLEGNAEVIQFALPRLLATGFICYIYFYLNIEQRIELKRKNLIGIASMVLIVFSLEFFLLNVSIGVTKVNAVSAFLFEGISITFSMKILGHNRSKSSKLSKLGVASISVVSASFVAPFVLNFGQSEFIRATIINLPFFIIASVYIYEHIKHSKIEEDLIYNNTFLASQSLEERNQIQDILLDNRKLSVREKEIVLLFLKRVSYTEIGDQLNISPATVRSHAKTIRKKLGVKDQDEFNRKYLNS